MLQVFHGMLGDVLKDNFIRFMVTGQQATALLLMDVVVQRWKLLGFADERVIEDTPAWICECNAINSQDYVQWLLRSGGDRFFRSWLKPAKAHWREITCFFSFLFLFLLLWWWWWSWSSWWWLSSTFLSTSWTSAFAPDPNVRYGKDGTLVLMSRLHSVSLVSCHRWGTSVTSSHQQVFFQA